MKTAIVSIPFLLLSSPAAWCQTPATAKPAAAKPAATKPAAAKPAVVKPAAVKPAVVDPAAVKPVAADPVVLTFGDQKMTRSEFERFLDSLPENVRAQAKGPNRRKLAEQIADLKVLAVEARKRGLDQKPDVRFQMENVLAGSLYQQLAASAIPEEAAVRGYYDQHKTEYEQAKARHILVRMQGSRVPVRPGQTELAKPAALAKARELHKRLLAGEDFTALAKAESDDAGSGASGGDLGSFGHGQMVGPFDQAAFSLPVGQVSEPVETPFGFHLIQVQERGTKKFEDVRAEIENRLKPELARKAVEALRKQAGVTLDDAYFGPLSADK